MYMLLLWNIYALVGWTWRYTVVVVCVCVILWDSCSHFLHDRWKLKPKTCNASLTQYYLEMKLVNFGLVALMSSYGMICSPRWQLPAIQSPAKDKFPTTGCLSTIYTTNQMATRVKSRERDCQNYAALTWTACNWRRSLIWHPPHRLHANT